MLAAPCSHIYRGASEMSALNRPEFLSNLFKFLTALRAPFSGAKPALCNELSALLAFTPGADAVAALVFSSIERGIRFVKSFINTAQ